MFYIAIARHKQVRLTPKDFRINWSSENNNKNAQVITYTCKTVHINDLHDKFGHVGETLLKKTMRQLGYEVKGTLKSCDACRMAKARAKGVKKHTETRSIIPRERMYINLTGPFSPSHGGSKY